VGEIDPPGDAKEVVAVGAVGTDSVITSFSSRGMMADGRVKPDFVSVGRNTVTIGQNGLIGTTNGTSLSSPFLAGLIASLWSIHPELHRTELLDIVMRSSDRYASPDTVYGYGIPDFQKAMKEVLRTLPEHPGRAEDDRWLIEPATAPTSGSESILFPDSEFEIESFPGSGTNPNLDVNPRTTSNPDTATSFTPGGVYQVKVFDRAFSGEAYRVRLMDESGVLLSEHFIGEADKVIVPIPRHAWENSRCLYFMIEEPFKQSTYRIGLR
jgi:subtilisin family serine protease